MPTVPTQEELDEKARQDAAAEEQNKQDDRPAQTSNTVRYFRTRIAGLSVVVGQPKEGEVAPETVRFKPVSQMFQGDPTPFGYLSTKNPVALKKLAADPYVEQIDKDEYDKVMKAAKSDSDLNTKFLPQ